jgi:hypothetical protein
MTDKNCIFFTFFYDPLISYDHYLFGSPEFSYEQNVEISWQCNPLLSTRNDLTEFRVVN